MKTQLPNLHNCIVGPMPALFLTGRRGAISSRMFYIAGVGATLCQYISFGSPDAPLAKLPCRPDMVGYLFRCN